MVASLGLGIFGFIGNKAEGYSPLSFSGRLVFAGILIALILFTGLTQPPSDRTDYMLSYICFALGIAFLVSAIIVIFSRKISDSWWRLVRRKEQSTDRRNFIFVLFVLSFGFFFAFFLFYPPFLSIG